MADREQVHVHAQAGDSRGQQWRVAGWGLPPSAAWSVRGDVTAGGSDGYVTLPEVHDRVGVDVGLRIVGQSGRLQVSLCVLALAQFETRNEVSSYHDRDGGSRRQGRART